MGCFSPGEVTLSLKVPSKESGERPFDISHSFPYSCMWRAWLPGNQVSGLLCACIRLGNVAVLKLSVAETYAEMSLGLGNYFLNFHSKTHPFQYFCLRGGRTDEHYFECWWLYFHRGRYPDLDFKIRSNLHFKRRANEHRSCILSVPFWQLDFILSPFSHFYHFFLPFLPCSVLSWFCVSLVISSSVVTCSLQSATHALERMSLKWAKFFIQRPDCHFIFAFELILVFYCFNL